MHRPSKIQVLVSVLALSAALSAQAQDPEASAPPAPLGAGTQAWLDLQVGGTAASAVERPLPGDVASRTYDRYANSFAHPIPPKFDRESFSAAGGNSGR